MSVSRRAAPIAGLLVACLSWSLAPTRAFAQDQGWGEMAPPQPPGPEEAQATPVTSVPQPFDSTLSSSGNWVYVAPYGWSWQPDEATVGPGFQPYVTGGSWVDTDDGWSFQTGWPWGDITFHYGRWYLDPTYGWLWLPGTQWAPAWVDWRFGGGYCGWAPLGPPGYVWRGGREAVWNFVDVHHFGEGNASRWVVRQPEQVHQAYASTTRVQSSQQAQGVRWNAGPSRAELAGAGAPVPHVQRARPQALHLSSATVVPKPTGRATPHPTSAAATHAAGQPHAAPPATGPEHQPGEERPRPPATTQARPAEPAQPPEHAAPREEQQPQHPAESEHPAPHEEPHPAAQPARPPPASHPASHAPASHPASHAPAPHPAPSGHPAPAHPKEEHK